MNLSAKHGFNTDIKASLPESCCTLRDLCFAVSLSLLAVSLGIYAAMAMVGF